MDLRIAIRVAATFLFISLRTNGIDAYCEPGLIVDCQETRIECNNSFYFESSCPYFEEGFLTVKFNGDEKTTILNDVDYVDVEWKGQYKQIKSIDGSYNDAQLLPSFVFTCSNIESIDFSNNQINGFIVEDFDQLSKLKILNLSNNVIQHITAESMTDDCIDLDALEHLILSGNRFQILKDYYFNCMRGLTYLDLSHNEISVIGSNVFNNVDNLEHLDLSHNYIASTAFSLNGCSRLGELYLSYNKINMLKKDFFANLNQLLELRLDNNNLQIDNCEFELLVSLHVLNMSHNNLESIKRDTFQNNTQIVLLDLSYNDISSIEINAFVKNTLIDVLLLEGNKLEGSLNYQQLQGLNNVLELNFSHHNLVTIEDFAFSGANHIEKLYMSGNKLTKISSKAFNTLNKLNTLDLSHNNLYELSFNVSDLINLAVLSLNNNRLTSVSLKWFSNVKTLKYLDLSNNDITHLLSNTFQSLVHLSNLKLNNNPLVGSLNESAFNELQLLLHLDLSGTQLSSIGNFSFNGMNSIVFINISMGNLSHIDYDAFRDTGSLIHLNLARNSLRYLSINKEDLKSLRALDLAHNLISAIEVDTFSDLRELESINLAHNNLSTIHPSAFDSENLPSLSYLDISNNNEILHVDFNLIFCNNNFHTVLLSKCTFDNVHHISYETTNKSHIGLKELSITSAHILNVDVFTLRAFVYLEVVDLSRNNLLSVSGKIFRGINHLIFLNLRHNSISNIEPGAFQDNVHLKQLDLSYNDITKLGHGIFQGLQNLQFLNLSYNKIYEIKVSKLYNLRSLKTLVIDGNLLHDLNLYEIALGGINKISLGDNLISCQQLVDFKIKVLSSPWNQTNLQLSALSLGFNSENVDGITCSGKESGKIASAHNNADMFNGNLEELIKKTVVEVINRNKTDVFNTEMIQSNITNKEATVSTRQFNVVSGFLYTTLVLLIVVTLYTFKSKLPCNVPRRRSVIRHRDYDEGVCVNFDGL